MLKLTDILMDLVHLDIDAEKALNIALKQIDDKEIFKTINEFRLEHVRHVEDLNKLIIEFAGTPPRKSFDVKGLFMSGFTMMRSMTGATGALNAILSIEKNLLKNYQKMLDENPNIPNEVTTLLQKHYGDERKHVHQIEQLLETLEEHV